MSPKKILFLGTHGQYNIGDELLLETFLSQLGDQHEYYINSYDPEFTARQLTDKYKVQVFHTTQSRWQLPALILRSDLLFFAGGSIIKELYHSVGRNQYATLLMILSIVTFAKVIARKTIIMSNIGVGPLQTRFGHSLAGLILHQADYVSLRDQKSYDTCVRVGIDKRKLSLVADAVFVHDASSFAIKQADEQEATGKLKIALNLNFNIENPDNWDLFIESLARSLREIYDLRPFEIHALPMQSHFNPHNDLKVLTAFRDKIPGIEVILHEPATPCDMAQIIATCDLVVAERLHSLITAAILHKPFVSLTYDVKVRELAKMLGMDKFAIDINQPFASSTLTHKVLTLSEQQHRITTHLKERTSELGQQMRDYFKMINERVAAA